MIAPSFTSYPRQKPAFLIPSSIPPLVAFSFPPALARLPRPSLSRSPTTPPHTPLARTHLKPVYMSQALIITPVRPLPPLQCTCAGQARLVSRGDDRPADVCLGLDHQMFEPTPRGL
jgi:hypothetical protein